MKLEFQSLHQALFSFFLEFHGLMAFEYSQTSELSALLEAAAPQETSMSVVSTFQKHFQLASNPAFWFKTNRAGLLSELSGPVSGSRT